MQKKKYLFLLSFTRQYRCYAEQRLACVNADGAAQLVLSFKNHIRRRGGTVARPARDENPAPFSSSAGK